MKTYYDVLQLLKGFGTYIHVGRRVWDIELAALELARLHQAKLIDDKVYLNAKIVLRHAHEQEERDPLNHELPLHSDQRRNDQHE